MLASRNTHQIRFFTGDRPVSPEDVITVRQAFSSCDPGLLVRVLLEEELSWSRSASRVGGRGLRALECKAKQALRLFYDMPVLSDSHRGRLLVPLERFERDGEGRILRRLLAVDVDLDSEADGVCDPAERGGYVASVGAAREAYAAWREPACVSLPGWRWWLPQAVGLASLAIESWPVSLSRRIWLPSTLSEWDRACVVGNVFWLMTYRGGPSCDFAGDSSRALATRVRVSEDGCEPVEEIRFVSGDPAAAASAIVSVEGDARSPSQPKEASRTGSPPDYAPDSLCAARMFEEDGLVAMLNFNCRLDMLQLASLLRRNAVSWT